MPDVETDKNIDTRHHVTHEPMEIRMGRVTVRVNPIHAYRA